MGKELMAHLGLSPLREGTPLPQPLHVQQPPKDVQCCFKVAVLLASSHPAVALNHH